MLKKLICVATGALAMAVTVGAAAPMPAAMIATQSSDPDGYYCFGGGYDSCWPIAYSHEVYSDETMTTLIGSGSDTCNGGPHVTSPWLPSGYTVKTRMFVCSGMGPYLPSEW
jgi:hypothetical protein